MTDTQGNNLEVLASHRYEISLAEVAAWLHNYDKCSDKHLRGTTLRDNTQNPPPESIVDPIQYLPLLATYTIRLLGEEITLIDLIKEFSSSPDLMTDMSKEWLIRALGFCHSVAHTEKADRSFYSRMQEFADLRSSSPFGHDSSPPITSTLSLTNQLKSLLEQLKSLLPDLPSSRSTCRQCIENTFSYALGDTRRPLNEVTLWDWSNIVAAFYKAAIAQALLDDPVEPPLFLRWRLLGVRIDATAFSENVTRIPDLKARQELLTNGLDKVRILLEETYPLGTEVYRDANGSMFIVPDIPHLLSLVNGQKELLSDRIKKEFSTGTVKEDASLKLGDEVVPSIEFDPNKKNAWFWYDPASHHAPLPIVDHLTQRPESAAKPSTVSNWWQNYSADICTVCQLRPQGWGATDRKALHRKLCAVCEERRNDRCADWTTELATTIWLDEVADVYGRLALVVGKLDLKHWLDGTLIFYPAAVSEENTNQIKARVIFPFKTVGNSTPPAELRLLDRTYKLNPSLRIFESTRYIKGDQLPLRFKSNKLKIAGSNESVKVMDVEGLPNGSYSITIDRLPPNVSPDSSFSIQKSSRQIIDFHVAADGPQLEAISPSAVEFIEDEILYAPGVILEQRIVQPVVVEAQTPARIQRVWKTAQQFWEQQEKKIGEVIKPVSSRLRLKTRFEPSSKEPDSLATYHTYELKVDNLDLSIVRVAKDEFLTIDNLSRAAVLLSPSKAEVFEKDYDEAENHVRAKLLRDRRFQVEQPTGYGSPNKLLGTLYIEDVTPEETIYAPFVTILKEPGTFMVLVPATEALNAVNSIREIYNDQMGKVRSRLPLTVGIVFAGRRTPLPAILNAGRRMLELPTIDECWEIDSISEEIDPWSKEVDPWPNRIKLQMRKDETALPATVQITLGDEKQPIPDRWYPYWEMGSPYSDDWVHTCDLRKGNKILMSSSRFDFEFLDTAARRFEISYNNGKRRGTFLPGSTYHPARPYYLEQLEEFDKLWTALSEGLETTQIDSLIGIIEEKRMEWLVDRNDEVFRQAVYDALDNADWKADKRPNADQFKQLRRTALSGQLTDVVELYISILKQRPEADESQTKNMMGVTL